MRAITVNVSCRVEPDFTDRHRAFLRAVDQLKADVAIDRVVVALVNTTSQSDLVKETYVRCCFMPYEALIEREAVINKVRRLPFEIVSSPAVPRGVVVFLVRG